MARMHSGKKGKAGSKKPAVKRKPTWLRYSNKEVESLIVKLAKAGNNSSQIGLILRDSYGIPDVKVITNKRICQILEENKVQTKLPEDLIALIKKDIDIMKHLETNKKDMTAKRGQLLTESKINRLVKYYKNVGRLDASWKYERKDAKLLIG